MVVRLSTTPGDLINMAKPGKVSLGDQINVEDFEADTNEGQS